MRSMLMMFFSFFIVIGQFACESKKQPPIGRFEKRLELWRNQLKMPAFSDAVARNGQIIWSKGFGYADAENKIPASDTTVYHLASLTKSFAAIILLQLVEQGKVDLDAPISQYNIYLEETRQYNMDVRDEDSIRVRHLLTHTAEGVAGTFYHYSGYLYGFLDNVIEQASGQPFAQLLVDRIIRPLGLKFTAPNIRDSVSFAVTEIDSLDLSAHVARPYVMDSLYQMVPGQMETYFGVSAGLMSSARDMARFSMAIDRGRFLKADTWPAVLSPTISVNGDTLPYGYGWFIQHYKSKKLAWHYGYWNTNSSLIIKVPAEKLTFVIIANSNLLSRPFGLGGPDGSVFHSPFAIEFARHCLYPERIPSIDYSAKKADLVKMIQKARQSEFSDLLLKELFAHASAHNAVGDLDRAADVFAVYNNAFASSLPDHYCQRPALAQINAVTDNAHDSVDFQLTTPTDISVFAIGEGIGHEMYDYGWIENTVSGDTLWMMDIIHSEHDGGSDKNRLIDTTLTLPAGSFRLYYRSDDSHSYNRWNARPPEIDFYGILLVRKG